MTNLVHISVSKGGASQVGDFPVVSPRVNTKKKMKSSSVCVANVITCSGSAALCMSSLYKLRVLLLCHPTGDGSDDAKI